MKLFEVTQHNTDNISGFRIEFLWIFSVSLTHNHNKGSHLSIGFGINPLELSMQMSIWSL
jgi:hypothetical protein